MDERECALEGLYPMNREPWTEKKRAQLGGVKSFLGLFTLDPQLLAEGLGDSVGPVIKEGQERMQAKLDYALSENPTVDDYEPPQSPLEEQ